MSGLMITMITTECEKGAYLHQLRHQYVDDERLCVLVGVESVNGLNQLPGLAAL